MRITLLTIAKACHAINAAYCLANGDKSQLPWDEAPQAQRESAINGVALHVTDEHMSPTASHEAWMAQKTREGWKYGEVKDFDAKTHPCYLPYDELPASQKAKDYLFKATVAQFRPFLPGSEIAAAAEIAMRFNAAGDVGHAAQVDAHDDAVQDAADEQGEGAEPTADDEDPEPVQQDGETAEELYDRMQKWQERQESRFQKSSTDSAETEPKPQPVAGDDEPA